MENIINFKRMLDDLNDFNYILFKYSDFFSKKYDTVEKVGLNSAIKNEDAEKYTFFEKHESLTQHSFFSRTDFNSVRETIQLVYDDTDKSNDFIRLIIMVKDKIINEYLNIKGLNPLFNEKYFEYEWKMHLGLNFDKHSSNFYRDHFIHQIKNFYTCKRILDEGLFKHIKNTSGEFINVFSNYVKKTVDYAVNNKERFLERDCMLVDILKAESIDTAEYDDKYKNYAFRYLIYGTAFTSSLFHDIGYPVADFFKNKNDVFEFIPYITTQSYDFEFEKICSILENSLLFQTIKRKELERKMRDKDHGVLSAFILLLQMYKSGEIRELPPLKKAIIELSALVIYDHTIIFGSLKTADEDEEDDANGENNKRADNFRPIFIKNPLSYLLRIVDDLQEWGRLYFEIGRNSNITFCNDCSMPILKHNDKKVFETQEEVASNRLFFEHQNSKVIYVCACKVNTFTKKPVNDAEAIKQILIDVHKSKESSVFSLNQIKYNQMTGFDYRKMNYVSTCDKLKFTNSDNKTFDFEICYNPYKLLDIMIINPGYATHRMKESYSLFKQFEGQGELVFRLKSLVSSNPILLKIKILCDFFQAFFTFKKHMQDNKFEQEFIDKAKDFLSFCNVITADGFDSYFDVYQKPLKLKSIAAFNDAIIKILQEFINAVYIDEDMRANMRNCLMTYLFLYKESKKRKRKKPILPEPVNFFADNAYKFLYKASTDGQQIFDLYNEWGKRLKAKELQNRCKDFCNVKNYFPDRMKTKGTFTGNFEDNLSELDMYSDLRMFKLLSDFTNFVDNIKLKET